MSLWACVLMLLVQPSDERLGNVRLDAFWMTRGASELGRHVVFTLPAKAFAVPKLTRGGVSQFVWKKTSLLVPAGDAGLKEVRRRGGTARIRAHVIACTEAEQKRGAPPCVVVVNEISYAHDPRFSEAPEDPVPCAGSGHSP